MWSDHWSSCTGFILGTAWVKILLIDSLSLKRPLSLHTYVYYSSPWILLAFVYIHRDMLPQWPTFPHVPTYQITLPTYIGSCVAEYKKTEDSQLRIVKIHWQRTSDVPTVMLHCPPSFVVEYTGNVMATTYEWWNRILRNRILRNRILNIWLLVSLCIAVVSYAANHSQLSILARYWLHSIPIIDCVCLSFPPYN